MEVKAEKYIVFVDTSYLTKMPSSERPDWERLLEYSKECVGNIDIAPRLEIHISEVALSEYTSSMRDHLTAKIKKAKDSLIKLQKERFRTELGRKLDFSVGTLLDDVGRGIGVFPTDNEIDTAINNVRDDLLGLGIEEIKMELHHNDEVVRKYFSWEPPFDKPDISERDKKNIREKRRTHIPDAWILEAAIDSTNKGIRLLCLCGDDNLCDALEIHGHTVYASAQDIYDQIFSVEDSEKADTTDRVEESNSNTYIDAGEEGSPLQVLLRKSMSPNMENIIVRILGYLPALNSPLHETLINLIVKKGFSKDLVRSCATILSDKDNEIIKDTGTHFLVANEAVCREAAELLQDEIIAMLDEV